MQLFILCIYFLHLFTLHVSGSHKPIIRGISSCFYIQPFGSFGVYVAHLSVPVDWFVVVVSLYWCRGGSPEQPKISDCSLMMATIAGRNM